MTLRRVNNVLLMDPVSWWPPAPASAMDLSVCSLPAKSTRCSLPNFFRACAVTSTRSVGHGGWLTLRARNLNINTLKGCHGCVNGNKRRLNAEQHACEVDVLMLY